MDLLKATLSRKGGDAGEKVSVNAEISQPVAFEHDTDDSAVILQLDVTQKRTKLATGSTEGDWSRLC